MRTRCLCSPMRVFESSTCSHGATRTISHPSKSRFFPASQPNRLSRQGWQLVPRECACSATFLGLELEATLNVLNVYMNWKSRMSAGACEEHLSMTLEFFGLR